MARPLLALVATLFLAHPLCAATTITISNTVIVPSVKRFGINLGPVNYFDSGQVMKELVFRNPGFEGQLFQSLIRCASGTTTSCIDDIPYLDAATERLARIHGLAGGFLERCDVRSRLRRGEGTPRHDRELWPAWRGTRQHVSIRRIGNSDRDR